MEELWQQQIDEELNIKEMEHELENDPRYWLWNAVDYLDKANELLFNKGIPEPRDMVLKALYNAKQALKRMENEE